MEGLSKSSLTFEHVLDAEKKLNTNIFHAISGGRDYIPTDEGYLALIDGHIIRVTLSETELTMRYPTRELHEKHLQDRDTQEMATMPGTTEQNRWV